MMLGTVAERGQILVVDDRESVLQVMARVLGGAHEVTTTDDPGHAMRLLVQRRFDVLLTDVRMPKATGFELLAVAKRCFRPPRVVMMTGFACVPDAVTAMRLGAFDYLAKPLEAEEIALVIARALEERDPDAPACTRAPSSGDGACDAGGGPRGADPTAACEVAMVFHDAVASARDRASRDYLVALMRQFHGNVTHASARAGITRESLHRLLKRYDVHSEAFKSASH